MRFADGKYTRNVDKYLGVEPTFRCSLEMSVHAAAEFVRRKSATVPKAPKKTANTVISHAPSFQTACSIQKPTTKIITKDAAATILHKSLIGLT